MNKQLSVIDKVQYKIHTIRGVQVMLDRDIAELYGVATKVLNQAVKRNIGRFPELFRFQLNNKEKNELVTTCDQYKKLKHSYVNPYAFTEQGIAMLSAVLHSDIAIKVSIQIMQAFVEMKKLIAGNAVIFQRMEKLEQKQLITETRLDGLFELIETEDVRPKQGIFYDNQVYDAYLFVAGLIKRSKTSIILLDNYIDESVLTLLSKRNENCTATIFTKQISKQLKLDLQKHNQQYPQIELRLFKNSHDRFLILDNKEIYHFGASLKDLGKKWFAFSKFDKEALEVIGRLNEKAEQ
ncbi:MAG: ORF6N domain-containing protein [Bacteroidetes bacterium]|nr:ORF6N domain-containing protein [Bacteroidota bacterium]